MHDITQIGRRFKLNNVLGRIAEHTINQVDEQLHWSYFAVVWKYGLLKWGMESLLNETEPDATSQVPPHKPSRKTGEGTGAMKTRNIR